ncbi:YihY/virulence factor BrkB family protein [Prosthecobacter sp.]|uniref:YihY/virulence factor BrkB family protein n=1 Tax=Prosthecobacter sp. TaxID=1965333 RepID=UPI002AB7FEE0|nr:YihY/virulence factor BrkB family protein [Prosthecobacter sp.]MDZ4405943.1 YihY/virulence factor BrkB family protein [Prosthecobacter sp.]
MKFFDIDGEQRAAAFAYYAFFALFPLIFLFVTLGSKFWDNATVVSYIIDNLGHYVPLNTSDRGVVDVAIHGIVDARGGISALAMLGLIWSSTHFFHAMVRGVNRAWGTIEYPWWRLPLHSFMMLGLVASALFIGVLVPLGISHLRHTAILQAEAFSSLFDIAVLFVPSMVLFYGLSMFFKFSPRRRTQFSEVALAALLTTILLQVCRNLFERYVYELSNYNAVYGAVAVVIVLLVWIYLSGVIIIYGGCLCAAQAEEFGRLKPPLRRGFHRLSPPRNPPGSK